MEQAGCDAFLRRCGEPEALERGIAYLAEHLGRILKPRERVLICFPRRSERDLSWMMEQAAVRCGAAPVVWGPDFRWKTLLRMAFLTKASAIIGAPAIVLGLMKLRKNYATPLYIRKVITAGYPCMDWMIDGIREGFDCQVSGCFTFGLEAVAAGFACGHSLGVHLWDAEFGVEIVDGQGRPLPPGQSGEIVLYRKDDPALRCATGENARLEMGICGCGSASPRLMDFTPGKTMDPDLFALGQYLQSWTSILDCRLRKGPYGLEMELMTFPGEKLPELPTAAKRILRPWDPAKDEPFWYVPRVEPAEISGEMY